MNNGITKQNIHSTTSIKEYSPEIELNIDFHSNFSFSQTDRLFTLKFEMKKGGHHIHLGEMA